MSIDKQLYMCCAYRHSFEYLFRSKLMCSQLHYKISRCWLRWTYKLSFRNLNVHINWIVSSMNKNDLFLCVWMHLLHFVQMHLNIMKWWLCVQIAVCEFDWVFLSSFSIFVVRFCSILMQYQQYGYESLVYVEMFITTNLFQ